MTFGLSIIAHALRMLIHEPGTTFRVILPGLAMVLASTIAVTTLVPDTLAAIAASDTDTILTIPPSDILLMLALGLSGLLGYALMAIHWHRHVLLNGPERARDLRPGWGVIAFYVWRAFTLALVQMLTAVPILTALSILASLTGGPGGGGSVILGVVGGIAFLWVAMRFSVTLPAAAMGERMGLVQSWIVTAPLSGPILAVAALLSLLSVFMTVVASLVFPATGAGALLLETCVFLAEGIIFVSVLTTLYGHLVEGRPLS
ncbi:hypothetical protein BOO69_06130 [Sulfitobacter alexandrii]|uniref:DUF4013 domain-containing protein n=1 Tax=Sulfitobacter alexandrii TaxID=1917485 RepID=A0A1J0WFE5_9RHOB|nr:hypothetical protein [Sulfitobacter alexandrii]APE43041.1 hypothetical protein BOO69_06130 [Sulfitobacter alexandrii]